MNDRSLAGRTIVVTRAANQAVELVQLLEELGASVILLPLIHIVDPSDGGADLRDALEALGRFDWLVVTSPNGARRVAAAVGALGVQRPRTAVVGQASAAALGGAIDLVPRQQFSGGLADEFPVGSGTVLVVQPEPDPLTDLVAAASLPTSIAAKGWTVRSVHAYRTVAVRPTPEQIRRVRDSDAVVFASGSAVRAWVSAFGKWTPEVSVVIGPSTAQEMLANGLQPTTVATDHSVHGLVDALVAQISHSK